MQPPSWTLLARPDTDQAVGPPAYSDISPSNRQIFAKISPIMFPQPSASIYQSSTCFVTYGTMGHVDRKQLPQRGKPWTAIAAQDFIHKVCWSHDNMGFLSESLQSTGFFTCDSKGKPADRQKVDLIASQECYSVLYEKLVEQRPQPVYARVTMTLGQLLEAEFLTEYVKKGTNLLTTCCCDTSMIC